MATATIRISGPFTKNPVSASAAPVAPAKPWYRRLFDVMIEARMAQAVREIERHRAWTDQLDPYRNLTPLELELAGLRRAKSGQLPFNRD